MPNDTAPAQQTTNQAPAAPPPAAEPTMEELASTLFKPADAAANDMTSTEEGSAATAEGRSHTPAGDPAAPPPADEKKPPEQNPRVAKRIEVATKLELRAAEARRESEALRTQLDARATELDAREAKLKLLEEDPIRAFDELKIDPKAFLEKLAGEKQPENEWAKRIAALEEQVKSEREMREKIETETRRRESAAQIDAAWNEATKAFTEHVGANAEKFPHLVQEYTEKQAAEKAYAILAAPVEVRTRDGKIVKTSASEAYRLQYGDYPDHDVIAEHLDAVAKADIDARANSVWRKRTSEDPATASKAPSGDKPEARTAKGSNPRTLTSREASERGTAPKPWSQEAADEESVRILEGALRRS